MAEEKSKCKTPELLQDEQLNEVTGGCRTTNIGKKKK